MFLFARGRCSARGREWGWGGSWDLPSMFFFTPLAVGLVDETGLGSTGARPVVFLSALRAFVAGVSFLMAVGRGFFAAGFEAALGVVLVAAGVGLDAALGTVLLAVTGVALAGVEVASGLVAAGLLAEAAGIFFTVPSGVRALTGVAFAAAGALGVADVDEVAADVPVPLSFFGTFFTGVLAVSVVTGFFTGVAFVAVDVAVFTGGAAVFFTVEPASPATLEMLPTLAVSTVSLTCLLVNV
jgi:hypothetical protein